MPIKYKPDKDTWGKVKEFISLDTTASPDAQLKATYCGQVFKVINTRFDKESDTIMFELKAEVE